MTTEVTDETTDEIEKATEELTEGAMPQPDEVLVTINNERESSVTFQVNIQGVDTNDVVIRFMIIHSTMVVGFECVAVGPTEYRVTIPPLPFIEMGEHQCAIEVIANGYFFTALQGIVKVVETPKVSASIGVTSDAAPEASSEEAPAPVVAVSATALTVDEEDETNESETPRIDDPVLKDALKSITTPKKDPSELSLIKTLK